MNRIRLTLALSCALLIAGGCASFRSDDLDPPDTMPEPARKPSIALVVSGGVDMGQGERSASANALESLTESIARAYEESGCFSAVLRGDRDADLRAEIHVLNYGDPNLVWAVISGATLCVIPCRAVDNLRMTTTYRGRGVPSLQPIEHTAAVSTWIWILLLPLSPFAWPSSVASGALEDQVRMAIQEAHAQGLFQRFGAAGAGPGG